MYTEILLVASLATLTWSKPGIFDLFNPFDDYEDCSESALIFLQGLFFDVSLGTSLFAGPSMGLSLLRNTVISPEPKVDNGELLGGDVVGWFTRLPEDYTAEDIAYLHGELDRSMERIEKEIEYLINDEGICPENIVVAGMSQGGALTIWMALFSKYKLGGFIPMITSSDWLHLEDWQVPKNPTNKWTPILHINGESDWQTESHNEKGAAFMARIFQDYDFRLRWGEHGTTINPVRMQEIISWAKKKTNLKFSRVNPVSVISDVTDFFGFGRK